MEESLKNRIILILAGFAILFFITTVSSCGTAHRQRSARDKEMATRLDLEEKMNKFTQEKTAIEAKLNAANQDLAAEKASHDSTKKALLQEQLVNQSLKEELQKVTKLKEALEEDLKDALTGKTKTKKTMK